MAYNSRTNSASTSAVTTSSQNDYNLYHIGAYHMIGDDNYEPQRNNNFELHIYDLGNLRYVYNSPYSSATDATMNIPKETVQETLTLSTVSVGALNQTVEVIQVPYGNTKVKYAGLPSVDNVDIVYTDYIGKKTEQFINAWQALVFNPITEKIGRASEYKKPALLIETAPDGTKARVWRLNGCWPSVVKYGDYSYDGNGQVRQITMTLTYDKMYPINSGSAFVAPTAFNG